MRSPAFFVLSFFLMLGKERYAQKPSALMSATKWFGHVEFDVAADRIEIRRTVRLESGKIRMYIRVHHADGRAENAPPIDVSEEEYRAKVTLGPSRASLSR